MKKLIALLMILSFAMASNIYVLVLDSNFDSKGVYVTKGSVGDTLKPDTGMKVQVYSTATKLYERTFIVPKVQVTENFEERPEVEVRDYSTEDIVLLLPYFEESEEIRILDENNLLVTKIDVRQFIQLSDKRAGRYTEETGEAPLLGLVIIALIMVVGAIVAWVATRNR